MTRFERWSVWAGTLVTGATGIGYFWTKYLVTSSDPFAVINHPLQPLFLKLHIVVSPLLLFALGLIAVKHVWRHFVTGVRPGRKAGIATAVAVLPMVVTGYLIQVLTAVGWVRAMALSHIGFGFLYLAGIGVHQWALRGGRNGGRAPARREPAALGESPGRIDEPAARPGGSGRSHEPEARRGGSGRRIARGDGRREGPERSGAPAGGRETETVAGRSS